MPPAVDHRSPHPLLPKSGSVRKRKKKQNMGFPNSPSPPYRQICIEFPSPSPITASQPHPRHVRRMGCHGRRGKQIGREKNKIKLETHNARSQCCPIIPSHHQWSLGTELSMNRPSSHSSKPRSSTTNIRDELQPKGETDCRPVSAPLTSSQLQLSFFSSSLVLTRQRLSSSRPTLQRQTS